MVMRRRTLAPKVVVDKRPLTRQDINVAALDIRQGAEAFKITFTKGPLVGQVINLRADTPALAKKKALFHQFVQRGSLRFRVPAQTEIMVESTSNPSLPTELFRF